MKFKKLSTLLLVSALSVSMTACVSIEVPQNEISQNTVDKGGSVEKQIQATQPPQEITETVFVDDENCTFKISGIDEDDLWGYTLKADLENKTDKNLMFSLEDVSVNGYMCDPFWATSVQGGKKAKSDISFSSESFKELGIENVEEIEFTLSVSDADDWTAQNLVEETFIYTIDK